METRSLAPREVEILTLVGTGFTNPQIGASLFISENTVKIHVARVFGKLGVHPRRRIGVADADHRAGTAGPVAMLEPCR